jgi:predicted nucleic acid-binding Zn ribbon protein
MNNSFEQLSKLLENILKKNGLDKQVKETQVINIWKEIAGQKISRMTEPVKVVDGKLFVRVSNPSWRNELTLLKPKIKDKINTKLGDAIIKEIIFV